MSLEGIRVLEVSSARAASLGALMLAEKGAEVVKIDVGSTFVSETSEEPAFLDRGKTVWKLRSNTNLLKDAGELLAHCDVLVTDTKMIDEYGIDILNACSHDSIKLIVEGTGKDKSNFSDDLIHANTGIFTNVSFTDSILGLPPRFTNLPLASTYTAVHTAIAAVSALYARNKSGRGDTIRINSVTSMLAAMGNVGFTIDNQPWKYDIPPVPAAIKPIVKVIRQIGLRSGEKLREKLRGLGRKLTPPLMQFYKCKNGEFVYIFAMDHSEFAYRLLTKIGAWDGLVQKGLCKENPYRVASRQNVADPAALKPALKKAIFEKIANFCLQHDSDAVEKMLVEWEIPVSKVHSTEQWIAEETSKNSGLVIDVYDPLIGPTRQPGRFVGSLPNQLANQPRSLVDKKPEWRSTKTHRIIISYSQESYKAPLAGVKVLDLSSMVAGPMCARTLAELGAEVIKIDPVNPKHGPRMTAWYGGEVSHGKLSALLNIQNPEGWRIFEKLASDSHVVVHNTIGKTATQLDSLASSKTCISRVVAFGDSSETNISSRKGYDPVIQAYTGICQYYGTKEQPEIHAIASCIDCLTGYLLAFSTVCSLIGQSPAKRSLISLTQAATLIQSKRILSKAPESGLSIGPKASGRSHFQKIYELHDAWVYIDSNEQCFSNLLEELGLPLAMLGNLDSANDQMISQRLVKLRLSQACELFTKHGVNFARVTSINEIKTDPQHTKHVSNRFRIKGYKIDQNGNHLRRLEAALFESQNWLKPNLSHFPKLGQSTKDVLIKSGLRESELIRALSSGVISYSISEEYLPK